MAAKWTAFDFKNSLVTKTVAAIAIASPAYDPVPKVVSYFPSPDEDNGDSVAIGWNMTDDTERVALGVEQPQDEEVIVSCRVNVTRPGAGETVARAAEDRAAELMSEVDNVIRTDPPSVGVQTFRSRLTNRNSVSMAWFVGEGVPARRCVIEFDVAYRARTSKN
jgi:hypothetical protein